MARRRRLLERGRVGVSKHLQPNPPPVPPPTRGPGKSQAPAHGQGLGIGLYLMSIGSKPGGQQGGVIPGPAYLASTNTLRPAGNVGSLAVNLPPYAANNVIVINLCGDFLLATDTASAAGWTQDGVVASGQRIMFGFHRQMVGNEGSTVTFTFSTAFERPFAVAATYGRCSGVEATVATHLDAPASSWSCGPVATTGSDRRIVTLGFTENANFATVGGGAESRILVRSAGGGSQTASAQISDLRAPTAGNYTMTGTTVAPTTIHTIAVGLKP